MGKKKRLDGEKWAVPCVVFFGGGTLRSRSNCYSNSLTAFFTAELPNLPTLMFCSSHLALLSEIVKFLGRIFLVTVGQHSDSGSSILRKSSDSVDNVNE